MWNLYCKCGKEIIYTNKRSWYNAKRLGMSCKLCQNKKISNTLKSKYKLGILIPNNPKSDFRERKKFFRNCPTCNKKIGHTKKEKMKHSKIKKLLCNSCSGKKYNKQKYRITEESIKKMRATKAGFNSWEEYVEKYPEKQFYKREVWRLTYKQPIKDLPNWEKRGRCGVDGAYQLDHIISINEGWEKNIDPQVIAHINNLRMIPWKQNRNKW